MSATSQKKIQSIIFPKDEYNLDTAVSWARLNDFSYKVVEESEDNIIFVQEDAAHFDKLEIKMLREEEAVSASSGTLSTNIAIPDMALSAKKTEPDCDFLGLPCFNVDSNDFFSASTHRKTGTRHRIRNEKVRSFMKENGWKSPFIIKYENNHFRVK